jgi:hypothetical protein
MGMYHSSDTSWSKPVTVAHIPDKFVYTVIVLVLGIVFNLAWVNRSLPTYPVPSAESARLSVVSFSSSAQLMSQITERISLECWVHTLNSKCGYNLFLFASIYSVAFSPQANYTDWATATCQWNVLPTFVDRGVSRGQRGGSPTIVNFSFLDRRIGLLQ